MGARVVDTTGTRCARASDRFFLGGVVDATGRRETDPEKRKKQKSKTSGVEEASITTRSTPPVSS